VKKAIFKNTYNQALNARPTSWPDSHCSGLFGVSRFSPINTNKPSTVFALKLWLSLDTLSSDHPCNIGSSRLRGLLALVCNIGGKDGVTFGLIGLTLLMSIFTISLFYEYNKSKN
jgi:hypothetical protein